MSANVDHSKYSDLICLEFSRGNTALKEYPIQYFTLTECIKLYELCEGEPKAYLSILLILRISTSYR